jgi:hypothetical protein
MTAEVTAAGTNAGEQSGTSGGSVKVTVTESPGTEYVILERIAGQDASSAIFTGWSEFARETARSAEAAIKQALEGNAGGGTYVAISARSFKPFTVTPQTVTTLKLEEAK